MFEKTKTEIFSKPKLRALTGIPDL